LDKYIILVIERNLVLEGESKTKLVSILVQTRRVNRTTNGQLDTRTKQLSVAKSEDTRVGDLGLDKGSTVELVLGTDFQGNSVGALGIPNSLTTSLDVRADTVVVRGGEHGQGVSGVNSNSILGSRVAESSVVTGNLAVQNIISNFTTSKETFVANYSVDIEVGLENIKRSNSVDIRLLVNGIDLGSLLANRRKEGSQNLQLETLSKVIFELDLSVEVVGGSPSFSEANAVGLVRVLGLEITEDDTGLVVALTVNLEGNTVGSSGLDFELNGTDGEVLGKEVLAGLANIVECDWDRH